MQTEGSQITARYRDVILLASALAFGSSGCWHEMPRAGREAFVQNYLESLRDGTEFHRTYSLTRDSKVIGEVRPLLREPFSVARWSGPLLEDECYVDMADGSRLLLHVIQRERAVRKVALYRYPPSAS